MERKTNYEILDRIKYSYLEIVSMILLIVFTINPFIKVFFQESERNFRFMYNYNRNVLMIGMLVILIYFIKLRLDGSLSKIGGLLKDNIAITLFVVFGFLMIATTFLNGAPKIAIEGSQYRGEGLIGFLSYVVYFILAACLISERKKKIVAISFLITSTLVGSVIFVDYVFLNEKYNYAMGDYMIFFQYNHLGYYLLMSIMFFGMLFIISKKIVWKLVHISGFMFMTAVLLMNDTWGCQLALFVGIIFTIVVYSIGKGKFQPMALMLLLAMVATFLLAYFTNDRLKEKIETNIKQQIYDTNALLDKDEIEEGTTGTSRIRLWEHAFQYLTEKPIIGHGADVTGDRLDREVGNDRCHCEYLNYAVSFGIPTALIYIVAVFMVYLRGLRKKKELKEMNYVGLCAAFAYLASALVGNSMFYTAPFLFIALGMGYVKE